MARKFVIIASAVGVVAVAAGAYTARRRRGAALSTARSRPVPVAGAAENARRFAHEWHADDVLSDEFAASVKDEVAPAPAH